ncbi:hypothetical protein ACFV28_20925 [Streptomyces sp. NPDC059720]|uniref:hypothetical protein n=1 Tax=Streptomyces sp. NPDC059720 TaxID=3346924 RepID=UPI003693B686
MRTTRPSEHRVGVLVFDGMKAFTDGFRHRPATIFGTVDADVLAYFVPGFRRVDFVDVVSRSDWPE